MKCSAVSWDANEFLNYHPFFHQCRRRWKSRPQIWNLLHQWVAYRSEFALWRTDSATSRPSPRVDNLSMAIDGQLRCPKIRMKIPYGKQYFGQIIDIKDVDPTLCWQGWLSGKDQIFNCKQKVRDLTVIWCFAEPFSENEPNSGQLPFNESHFRVDILCERSNWSAIPLHHHKNGKDAFIQFGSLFQWRVWDQRHQFKPHHSHVSWGFWFSQAKTTTLFISACFVFISTFCCFYSCGTPADAQRKW